MVDPFGIILVTIRDDAIVASLTDRVSAYAEAPPSVRLRAQTTSREPFGSGSSHVGLQRWTGIAQCYGTDDPAGEILARRLAGAVSDALHQRSNLSGTAFILRAYAPTIGEAQRDPDTKWPFHTVRIEAIAAAQAVA